jgi:hypothetical protein
MTTLAELRQANIQEQKKQEESQNGHAQDQAAPPAEQQVSSTPKAHSQIQPREGRSAGQRQPMGTASGRRTNPAMAAPMVKESDKEALVEILPAISKAVVSLAAQVAVNEGEPEKSAAFLNRVRTSLNHKILYPSGVKTTVDMSPALFHRAKKYCLDHGNVTIRQLFLDLITEFLAEEGY